MRTFTFFVFMQSLIDKISQKSRTKNLKIYIRWSEISYLSYNTSLFITIKHQKKFKQNFTVQFQNLSGMPLKD